MKQLFPTSPIELCLAGRLLVWMTILPMVLWRKSLPSLLQTLSSKGGTCRPSMPRVAVERRIRIALRVSRLRLFDSPIFPKMCLRRSLALFWVLAPAGSRLRFYLGVQKEAQHLHAHSWVTLDGEPIREQAPLDQFRTIYTFPPTPGQNDLAVSENLQPVEATDRNIDRPGH